MGKYYETITRLAAEPEVEETLRRDRRKENGARRERNHRAANGSLDQGVYFESTSTALVPIPHYAEVLGGVVRTDAIRGVSERLAPLAVVDRNLRLAVGSCRPGDGASTVAVALAMDLSQRLSLRTILVDAHVRRPSLHHFFPVNRNGASELLLEGALQIRGTGWQRLELASCCVMDSEHNPDQALSDFEGLFSNYQAVVLDLGTPRLDARMLPLVRPTDPVLLVVKYGQTQRKELTTTTAALRAANRSIAGVILNGVTDPVPDSVRRFLNP